jgi:hemolysin activation/secretion protein
MPRFKNKESSWFRNKLYSCLIYFFLILVFVFPPISQAQDAGTLQRELELQLQRSAPKPQPQPEKSVPQKQAKPNEQKVVFKGFKFQGNTLLSNAQLEEVVKPWVNTEITFSDLKDVTSAIQNLYAQNNRIAQATIPPQDIVEGILLITINEGKLGSVIVEPAKRGQKLRFNSEIAKLYLANSDEDDPYINSKPIYRGMALLNGLPGVQATGEFEPGQNLGESDFRVKLSDGPLFSGQAAVSNYGISSTGVGQVLASLALNSPTGYGDQANLDAIQSAGSTLTQLVYSLPVGYDGWRVGVNGNNLTSKTLASWSENQVEGTARTIGLNASYALYRGEGSIANLRFSVENRNYQNMQSGAVISQYQIKTTNVAISGSFSDTSQSLINYFLSGTLGNLNIQNLTQAGADLSGPGTNGNYSKLSFFLSRTQTLSFLKDTTWLISASGQLANKNLNSAEQMYMGGAYAVRAYPVAQGASSQGLILSTQLLYRFDMGLEIGAFGDLGISQQYVTTYPDWQGATNANNIYQLGAVGPTIKYNYDNWALDAMAAFRVGQNPLYNSSGQQLNVDNFYRRVQAWIRGTYSF